MSNIIQVQDIIEKKITLNDAKSMVVLHKGEAYTFFDQGCTRHVYVNKDKTKVIKLLKAELGKDYNQEESEIYKNATDEEREHMVPTRLENGLVEQDYVTPIKFGGIKLSIKQRMFAASCRNEVGWTSDGKLQCFDLDEYKKY